MGFEISDARIRLRTGIRNVHVNKNIEYRRKQCSREFWMILVIAKKVNARNNFPIHRGSAFDFLKHIVTPGMALFLIDYFLKY